MNKTGEKMITCISIQQAYVNFVEIFYQEIKRWTDMKTVYPIKSLGEGDFKHYIAFLKMSKNCCHLSAVNDLMHYYS